MYFKIIINYLSYFTSKINPLLSHYNKNNSVLHVVSGLLYEIDFYFFCSVFRGGLFCEFD